MRPQIGIDLRSWVFNTRVLISIIMSLVIVKRVLNGALDNFIGLDLLSPAFEKATGREVAAEQYITNYSLLNLQCTEYIVLTIGLHNTSARTVVGP